MVDYACSKAAVSRVFVRMRWVQTHLAAEQILTAAYDLWMIFLQARAFAEGLNRELKSIGATGVHVTCICPTHINTNLFKGFDNPGSS